MLDFSEVVSRNARKYPLMLPVDAVKLAFQSEFGSGHFLRSPSDAIDRLRNEFDFLRSINSFDSPLFEPLGGRFSRLNLAEWVHEISYEVIARAFVSASKNAADENDSTAFYTKLDSLSAFDFPSFSRDELAQYIAKYKSDNCPVVSHSPAYKIAYKPHYRVVGSAFERFFPLIRAIATARKPVFIAIDGMCGSGKTTLASYLSTLFDCNVFRADDFFLPPVLRTPERLSTPGGNIHYERLKPEIIDNIVSPANRFSYGVFDCSKMKVSETRLVTAAGINILEGTYSTHPFFGDVFDVKVFLKTTLENQRARIVSRSSESVYNDFKSTWIPLENSYFEAFSIEEKADFVFS